jgi:hypothetical protein
VMVALPMGGEVKQNRLRILQAAKEDTPCGPCGEGADARRGRELG